MCYDKLVVTLLKIAQLGHPVLRQKAKLVDATEIKTDRFQELVDNMFATLQDSHRPGWNSVGLSGNQVYAPKRVFIVDMKLEEIEEQEREARAFGNAATTAAVRQTFVNPEILEISNKTTRDFESCLSLPDIMGVVERPVELTVKAFNRKGEMFTVNAANFYARLIQHEVDHLDGVLFVDRMENLQTLTFHQNAHHEK